MAQEFLRQGSPILQITTLNGVDGTIEFIPGPRGAHMPTIKLNQEGKALAEFLTKKLPRDTLHALRAFLM